MNCNISSIALTCLHLSPPATEVDRVWGERGNQGRENRAIIPLWLSEIFSRGYTEDGTQNTIITIVNTVNLVTCILPESEDDSIECVDI